MKKAFLFALTGILWSTIFGQSINFTLTDSTNLQDADVGAMAFGDIDNDGDQDLIITGKGGPVATTLYENDGLGNFTVKAGNTFEGIFAGSVAFEDIDGDTDLDLLIIGKNRSPVLRTNLYLNDGTGIFTLRSGTPFVRFEGGDFAFGDIDQDGDPDILLTGYNFNGDGFTIMYTNDGLGQFTLLFNTPFDSLKDSDVKFFDMDKDNDLDVILCGTNDNGKKSTLLYSNDGTGKYSIVNNSGIDNIAGGDIAVGDCDGDGDSDVFICGQKNNQDIVSELYLNNGTGSFSKATATFPGVYLGTNALSDFDADGDLDIFLIGTGAGGLANNSIIGNVYQNLGSNNFSISDSIYGAYFSSAAIADIDGDNDLDMVVGGTSTGMPIRGTKLYTNEPKEDEKGDTTLSIQTIDTEIPNLFPNPSSGEINISFHATQSGTIEVIDQIGRIVYTTSMENESSIRFELSEKPGIYKIVVQTENKNYVEKIILK